MKQGKLLLFIGVLYLIQFQSSAQKISWGQLIIDIPEGWSSNMKAGNATYSNYNIQGSEPFSITLFKPESLTGKTDSLFSEAWTKYLSREVPGTPSPRPKRWTTESDIPLFTANKELTGSQNPAFYLFGVYRLNDTYQAFLIHTLSSKGYREVQSEWQERLLGVLVNIKKK